VPIRRDEQRTNVIKRSDRIFLSFAGVSLLCATIGGAVASHVLTGLDAQEHSEWIEGGAISAVAHRRWTGRTSPRTRLGRSLHRRSWWAW